MNDELEKKIIKELKESGFGSEMKAVNVCLSRTWKASGFNTYFDKDDQITREYDLHVYRPLLYYVDKSITVSCFFHIVGEIKKTSKHWIVFKRGKKEKILDAWNNLIFYDNLPFNPSNFSPKLTQNTLIQKLGWCGCGVHEFTKPPNKPSTWYSAAIQACKAALYIMESESWKKKDKYDGNRSSYLTFIKPIVILDGKIFSAELTDGGEIDVQEIDAFVMDFEFQTKNYKNRIYHIDVITLDNLSDYLELYEKRHDYIHGQMIKERLNRDSREKKECI